MSQKSVVAPSVQCDYKGLCSILRNTLSNLHYETKACEACGWVDSSDADWANCTECGGPICGECASSAKDDADDQELICEKCSEAGAISESPIAAGDLVEMADGPYRDARFTVVELGALVSHGPSSAAEWVPLSELKKAKETKEEYDALVRAKLAGGDV